MSGNGGGGEVVIVTEGTGARPDVARALMDSIDELAQPGASSLMAGGSIGSSLDRVEDESEQHTPILRVGGSAPRR